MKVIVAGAGLCGLSIAHRLCHAGIEVVVLEGNGLVGGRVQPAAGNHHDLGPSWAWPYAQPVLQRWFEELGIETFSQFDEGYALIDQNPDDAAVRQNLPGQHGMVRVTGGTHAIVQKLQNQLSDVVRCNHLVTGCDFGTANVQTDIRGPEESQNENKEANCITELSVNVIANSNAKTLVANKLVLALPPRLSAALLQRHQALSEVTDVLRCAPTWMAQHAKVVIHYKDAFWRENDLSGRVASRIGPLVEIHDHCGPDGSSPALFGFMGVPYAARKEAGLDALVSAVQHQLLRCFGKDAPPTLDIEIKDWALETLTATPADIESAGSHPEVLRGLVRRPWCDNRLWFAGSETSAISPGLIEGAFARADQVAEQIIVAAK